MNPHEKSLIQAARELVRVDNARKRALAIPGDRGTRMADDIVEIKAIALLRSAQGYRHVADAFRILHGKKPITRTIDPFDGEHAHSIMLLLHEALVDPRHDARCSCEPCACWVGRAREWSHEFVSKQFEVV